MDDNIFKWVVLGAMLALIVIDKARYYVGRNGKKNEAEILGQVLEKNRESLSLIVKTSNGKYLDHDRKINKNTLNISHLGKKIDENTEQNKKDHALMFQKLDKRKSKR